MAPTRRWLPLLAALAVGLIGFWIWAMQPRAPRGVAPALAEASQPHETDAVRMDVSTVEREQAEGPLPATPVPPAAETATAATPTAAAAESWSLEGTVLRAADGTPIPALLVYVAGRPPAVSDERGRFEVELSVSEHPRGSRRRVSVGHPSQTILFGEELVLEPGLELRVDDEVVWLHGRVVDPLGAPVVSDAVLVSCRFDDDQGRLLGQMIGGRLDGSFRVAARAVDLDCDSVVLRVAMGRTVFPFATTLAALRSEEGATVVIDVCPVTIELRASDGGELAEAELRVVAWRPGAERAETWSTPELSDAHDARVVVERAVERIEVAAGASGCAPWVGEFEAPRCGSTLRIVLRRLGPDDVLMGVVLGADGRPVEHAFASCSPPTRDRDMVAVPAIRGARTDAAGRFSLPFPVGQTARVMAYHRDHGATGEELVQGGRRDLVLRFLAVARLDVTVSTPDGDTPGGTPTRFALGLADGTWRDERGANGRASIEEVPAGRHTLLCVSGDGLWWGLFEVDVFDTGPQEVWRTLAPARWVEGRLVDDAGAPLAGLEVRRLGAPVSDSAAWNPFGAQSDGEGRFRVLLGSEAEAEFAFVHEGVERVRLRLAAGDAGALRLAP